MIHDTQSAQIAQKQDNKMGAIYMQSWKQRARHCFHDCIYIMPILLLWDLSTLCVVDYLWPLILWSLPSLLSTLWFTSNLQPYIMGLSVLVATKQLWWLEGTLFSWLCVYIYVFIYIYIYIYIYIPDICCCHDIVVLLLNKSQEWSVNTEQYNARYQRK